MIPQLCGLRHQKETRQKTTESQFLNAGVLPSIGGLGQPRISHRSFLRRRNGLTTQHSKHKLELPRASHKRGLRSRDAVTNEKLNEQRTAERTEFHTAFIRRLCCKPALARPSRRVFTIWLRIPLSHALTHGTSALLLHIPG